VARTFEWSIHGNEAIWIREAEKFVAMKSVLAAGMSVPSVNASMRQYMLPAPMRLPFATIASAYKWNLGKNTDESWQAVHHGST